jgi:hypothetical protein
MEPTVYYATKRWVGAPRTFRNYVTETTRAKILGLNAARTFGFDVHEKYR